MEISWLISQQDVDYLKKFIDQNQNPFVTARIDSDSKSVSGVAIRKGLQS